jgi:hypothetical protein
VSPATADTETAPEDMHPSAPVELIKTHTAGKRCTIHAQMIQKQRALHGRGMAGGQTEFVDKHIMVYKKMLAAVVPNRTFHYNVIPYLFMKIYDIL